MKYETFNYYIVNSFGFYYRGTAYGDSRDWTNEKLTWLDGGAYTYSLNGAWKKICKFPLMFDGCEVIHIEDL